MSDPLGAIFVGMLVSVITVFTVPKLFRLAYRKGIGAPPDFIKKLQEKDKLEEEARFHEDRIRSWLRKQGLAGVQLAGDRGRADEHYIVKDTGTDLLLLFLRNRKWEPMVDPRGRTRLCYDLMHNGNQFAEVTPLSREAIEANEKEGLLSLVITNTNEKVR